VKASTCWSTTKWANYVEDFLNGSRGGDVVVAATFRHVGRISVVEEIDIDAIGVVSSPDWGDGGKGVFGFAL
jgi:acyl-coenzyme A thioesterase PaaI-like protein